MKKFTLLAFAAAFGLAANAQSLQTSTHAAPFHRDVTKTAKATRATTNVDERLTPVKPATIVSAPKNNAVKSAGFNVTETEIGESTYDLQSNRAVYRRVVSHPNNTVTGVWTMSAVATPFADRGTGYNYYDGAAWGAFPTARVEYKRTGFTNIASDGTNEYTLTHSADSGMFMSKRTIGTGSWTYSHPVGTHNLFSGQADVWSRLAVNGNYVHAIVNSQGTGTAPVLNMMGPVTYTRSADGGATWAVDHVLPALIDATQYYGFGADEYSMDARGTTVAMVLGGFTNDVVLLKSTDNGDTWTKTIVHPFPIPLYDPTTMISDVNGDQIADTIETNAGDVTVSIDNNGMCHVAFGYMLTLDDDPAAAESYFPGVSGMYYWNENMGSGNAVFFDPTIDYNQNGVLDLPAGSISGSAFGLYNVGLTCQPSIGFDATNNIYMSFAAINESADTTIFNEAHRHVYVIRSTDGGATWSFPYNIVPTQAQGGDGEYQEGVFASIAREVNPNVHIVYQRDIAAGHSLSNNTTQASNNAAEASKIIHATFDPTIIMGVADNQGANTFVANLYPNPVGSEANFNIEVTTAGNITIEVYNVVGKIVTTQTFNEVSMGNQALKVNTNALSAGTYTYKVKANSGIATGTFVKN